LTKFSYTPHISWPSRLNKLVEKYNFATFLAVLLCIFVLVL